MTAFRNPGPVCQTKDWFGDLDDGTLARTRSPLPSTLGSPTPGGQRQVHPPVTASGACAYLNPRSRGTVIAPQQAFDRLRNNSGIARISSPRSMAAQTWPNGSTSPAVEQAIQIDNQTIKVIRPTDSDATGKNLPTTVQLGEALRAIPGSQRLHTTTVILSPRPHPDSTSSRTIAGDAGGGVINLYPVHSLQSQNDFDNRLMHESGHNYQGSLWKSGQAVQEWQAVANADQRLPSPYAGETTGDDFSEFGILYDTARGTSCETTASQLYPNRWRKMRGYQP